MPYKKIRITIIIVLTLFLFISYTAYLFSRETIRKQLPVLGQVHDFKLTDAQGVPFSLKSLSGDIWVADFFFTTCGDICPIMTKNMAALHRSFLAVDGVRQVSITVNPEFDTQEVLSRYARKFEADPSKWHFLTGTREQITELALKSFKLGSIEEPVFHSAKFALVDRRGLVRGYYDGVQSGEVSRLFQDMALLLKEK